MMFKLSLAADIAAVGFTQKLHLQTTGRLGLLFLQMLSFKWRFLSKGGSFWPFGKKFWDQFLSIVCRYPLLRRFRC